MSPGRLPVNVPYLLSRCQRVDWCAGIIVICVDVRESMLRSVFCAITKVIRSNSPPTILTTVVSEGVLHLMAKFSLVNRDN